MPVRKEYVYWLGEKYWQGEKNPAAPNEPILPFLSLPDWRNTLAPADQQAYDAAWAAQCKLEQAEIDNKNLTLDFDLATYSTYETQCTRIWATQAACDAFSDDPEWVTWHNRYLADTEQTLEIKTVII